jgi:hypothetical protein
MTSHAACSPSSAATWMTCPASVTLTKDMTRPSSKFAREGTAAHGVAELILLGDVFLPDRVVVEGEEFIVSPGMCRALNPYVSHVQDLMKAPGTRFVIEQRIKVPGTHGMVWGTLDFGAFVEGVLHVVDLKFGRGYAVDASGPQLKFYALGLAEHLGITGNETPVTLTICQPRIEGPPLRAHATTLGELKIWRAAEVSPATARIKAGDTTEVVGPHCRWCVRQTECAAFNNRHQTYAAAAFDD